MSLSKVLVAQTQDGFNTELVRQASVNRIDVVSEPRGHDSDLPADRTTRLCHGQSAPCRL